MGFIRTTMAITCLASSAEARIGTSRNLAESSNIGHAFTDSAVTRPMEVIEGVASATTSVETQEATREQILKQEEQDQTGMESEEEQPKPLPSFDQVMHKDTPSHGMYVEGGSDRVRSFCARHNHLGPNSGCEQHHASLRGGHVGRVEDATSSSAGGGEQNSYLQQHVNEAQLRYKNKREHDSDRK